MRARRSWVGPGFDLPTVQATCERGVAVMPGALTPTEVMTAARAGADIVKIFPCSALGGAKYLRALKAPFPDVKLLPSGGVSVATAGEYIDAGASALGVGAEIVDIAALEASNDAVLTERGPNEERERTARHRLACRHRAGARVRDARGVWWTFRAGGTFERGARAGRLLLDEHRAGRGNDLLLPLCRGMKA